jgi:hypothetical protein
MKCQYCGKTVKSFVGLAKHQRQSAACIQAKRRLESSAKQEDDAKPSAQGFKSMGKRKVDLDQDLIRDAVGVQKMLASNVMQMLSHPAGGV